jgi:hypothetical protein
VLGWIGHGRVNVAQWCQSGRAREIRTQATVATTVVSVVTLGIYMPRRVSITCAP